MKFDLKDIGYIRTLISFPEEECRYDFKIFVLSYKESRMIAMA